MYKQILMILTQMQKDIAYIKEKIDKEPPEDTDAWWEWSHKKAREEIQKGKYTIVRDKKELQAHLDSLKKS